MWGERIAMAQAQGMPALLESTLDRWFTAGFRARQIHANLPNSQFVLIKDAAHIANIEQPEFFNRTLMEFMALQS